MEESEVDKYEIKWHEMEADILLSIRGFKDLYLAIDTCVREFFLMNGDHYQNHYNAAIDEGSFFYRQAVKERVKEIINEEQIDVKKMIVDMIVNSVIESMVNTTKRYRKGAK